jgi:gas vesicle protein
MMHLGKDDILHALGLEARRSSADMVLPAAALFGAGILVGAGLGLLFAPKAGNELRGDIARSAGELKGKLPSTQQLRGKARQLARNVRDDVRDATHDISASVYEDDEDHPENARTT